MWVLLSFHKQKIWFFPITFRKRISNRERKHQKVAFIFFPNPIDESNFKQSQLKLVSQVPFTNSTPNFPSHMIQCSTFANIITSKPKVYPNESAKNQLKKKSQSDARNLPLCAGPQGMDEPKRSIMRSFTLHFYKRLFSRLESVTSRWSHDNNFTSNFKQSQTQEVQKKYHFQIQHQFPHDPILQICIHYKVKNQSISKWVTNNSDKKVARCTKLPLYTKSGKRPSQLKIYIYAKGCFHSSKP